MSRNINIRPIYRERLYVNPSCEFSLSSKRIMEYHDAILREYYEYLNFLKWEKFENDKNIPPMLKKKKK